MSVDRAVKIVALLLPLLAFLAPLVYGFGEYGWDVRSFVVPRYKAPKIGVDLRFRSFSVSDSGFMLIFQANNTGEVDLRILSFDGVVYASSGEEIGELSLVQEVDLPKASSGDLVLEVKSREKRCLLQLLAAVSDPAIIIPATTSMLNRVPRTRYRIIGMMTGSPRTVKVTLKGES